MAIKCFFHATFAVVLSLMLLSCVTASSYMHQSDEAVVSTAEKEQAIVSDPQVPPTLSNEGIRKQTRSPKKSEELPQEFKEYQVLEEALEKKSLNVVRPSIGNEEEKNPIPPTVQHKVLNKKNVVAEVESEELVKPKSAPSNFLEKDNSGSTSSKIKAGFAIIYSVMFIYSLYRLKDLPLKLKKYVKLKGTKEYKKANISRDMKKRVNEALFLMYVLLPFELVDQYLKVFSDLHSIIVLNVFVEGVLVLISLVVILLVYGVIKDQFKSWWSYRSSEGMWGRAKGIRLLISGDYYNTKLFYVLGYFERGGSSVIQMTIIPFFVIFSSILSMFPELMNLG